ncbi:MAG: tRNA (adenosine(37)-N6)-threonylcarbamoyltransferase complex dimerization subunit type 1 TsaB [Patescibacteria group bacterium]
MTLYINTTGAEKVALALGKAGKLLAKREFKAKYQQSEKLLPAIDLLLQKAGIKLKNVENIVVVAGPGPFTATRIGVTVANALAYALKINIVGVKASEFGGSEELIKIGDERLRQIKDKRGIMAVEPFYDQEPNITIKK